MGKKGIGVLQRMRLISVIVPVYNTKKYLQKCLNSILDQTYTDLEILFVDDGSTDGSGELLDTFTLLDKRIRVIHQENKGVCAARNVGIEESSGEYLSFIDSDDTLEPDIYETLMGLILKYGVDIAHCSYSRITGGLSKPIGGSGALYLHDTTQALECLLTGTLFVGSCWTKLYARELFDSVRFSSSLKTNEDMLVNFQLFRQVNKSAFIDVCKYNYLTSDTSSCVRTPQRKRAEDLLEVNRQMLSKNDCPKMNFILENRLLCSLFSYYKSLVYEKVRDLEKENEVIAEINLMIRRGYSFSKRTSIEYMLLRRLPVLYKFAYSIYDRIRVPNYDV